MNIEKLFTHLLFRSFTMKKFDRAALNLTCSTSHAKIHLSGVEMLVIYIFSYLYIFRNCPVRVYCSILGEALILGVYLK